MSLYFFSLLSYSFKHYLDALSLFPTCTSLCLHYTCMRRRACTRTCSSIRVFTTSAQHHADSCVTRLGTLAALLRSDNAPLSNGTIARCGNTACSFAPRLAATRCHAHSSLLFTRSVSSRFLIFLVMSRIFRYSRYSTRRQRSS